MSKLNPKLHRKLEKVFLGMGRMIRKQDEAPTDVVREFEIALARVLTSEYQFYANQTLRAAIDLMRSGARDQAKIDLINDVIAQNMGEYGSDPEFLIDIEDMMTSYYGDMAKEFIKEFGLYIEKATMEGPQAAVSFTQRDRKAVEVISRLTAQSAGKYFPDSVQGKTSQVVNEVVLQQGLSNQEAAVMLERELQGALGIKDAGAVVPTHYASNPQAYFEVVTNNAALQASSVGRVVSMHEAGVEQYQVVAILDRRTSNICRRLDGRTFPVRQSITAVDRFLEVDNLSDLQGLMPFSRDDEVPQWAEEGLGFPPYHHKCRTTVIPTGV